MADHMDTYRRSAAGLAAEQADAVHMAEQIFVPPAGEENESAARLARGINEEQVQGAALAPGGPAG